MGKGGESLRNFAFLVICLCVIVSVPVEILKSLSRRLQEYLCAFILQERQMSVWLLHAPSLRAEFSKMKYFKRVQCLTFASPLHHFF